MPICKDKQVTVLTNMQELSILIFAGYVFLMCAISCVLYIIFACLFVPETFGKTLEDMEDHYRKLCYGNDEEIIAKADQVRTVSHFFKSYLHKFHGWTRWRVLNLHFFCSCRFRYTAHTRSRVQFQFITGIILCLNKLLVFKNSWLYFAKERSKYIQRKWTMEDHKM